MVATGIDCPVEWAIIEVVSVTCIQEQHGLPQRWEPWVGGPQLSGVDFCLC